MHNSIKVICDVDCTLYSHGEFLHSNYKYFKDTSDALLGISSEGEYKGIERTWNNYQTYIEDRIQKILDIYSKDEVLFLSAYPVAPYKEESFKKLGVNYTSSSTSSTKIEFVQNKFTAKTVIGDRPSDYHLAKFFNARFVNLSCLHFGSWTKKEKYSDFLQQKIKESL